MGFARQGEKFKLLVLRFEWSRTNTTSVLYCLAKKSRVCVKFELGVPGSGLKLSTLQLKLTQIWPKLDTFFKKSSETHSNRAHDLNACGTKIRR